MPPSRRRRTPEAMRGRRGFIHAYGLFWSAKDGATWTARLGERSRLLGRIGSISPNLQVCDFWSQRGIYVLYDHYGPYYVGLTRETTLGGRLRRHLSDYHAGRWDRFSWFGFRRVRKRVFGTALGASALSQKYPRADSASTIGDIEALLIQSLGVVPQGRRPDALLAGRALGASNAARDSALSRSA